MELEPNLKSHTMVTSAALILSILYIIFLELVPQLYGGREILNIGSAFLITVTATTAKKPYMCFI